MSRRFIVLGLLLLGIGLSVAACGKKGDPRPVPKSVITELFLSD